MRSVRLLIAASLAASGLLAVGTIQTAQAADAKDLKASYTKVMSGETFSLFGTLSTAVARPVKLQYKTGSTWKNTSLSAVSNGSGSFNFPGAKTTASRYFRYYAPASGGNARIIGNARRIAVVSQSVTFFGITPDSQCTNFALKDVTMFAQFSPARPGREVIFTSNKGNKTSSQDGKGNATVTFDQGDTSFSFNSVATAQSYHSAAAKSSSAVKYGQLFCSFIIP